MFNYHVLIVESRKLLLNLGDLVKGLINHIHINLSSLPTLVDELKE